MPGHLPRLGGERARSYVARRLVHQVARRADGVGDLASEAGGIRQGPRGLGLDQQLDAGELERLLLLLVTIEDVRAERRAFGERLHLRRVVYRHDDRKRLRPSRLRQLHRAGRRSPELVQRAVCVPLLSDADRCDALGADLAVRVKGEHLAFLAGELLLLGAAREQPIQHAIDRDELLALSDKKDEEAGGVRRGLCGDDGSRERHR